MQTKNTKIIIITIFALINTVFSSSEQSKSMTIKSNDPKGVIHMFMIISSNEKPRDISVSLLSFGGNINNKPFLNLTLSSQTPSKTTAKLEVNPYAASLSNFTPEKLSHLINKQTIKPLEPKPSKSFESKSPKQFLEDILSTDFINGRSILVDFSKEHCMRTHKIIRPKSYSAILENFNFRQVQDKGSVIVSFPVQISFEENVELSLKLEYEKKESDEFEIIKIDLEEIKPGKISEISKHASCYWKYSPEKIKAFKGKEEKMRKVYEVGMGKNDESEDDVRIEFDEWSDVDRKMNKDGVLK